MPINSLFHKIISIGITYQYDTYFNNNYKFTYVLRIDLVLVQLNEALLCG